jgi:hypothetical protein
MLQVSLSVGNLEVTSMAGLKVLVMTSLLLKSLELAEAAAAVLIVIPTASLDLQVTKVSVVLQVSLTVSLHPLLALAVHPVDPAMVLHHLLVRLVLVEVAALKASRLQIRLVDQEVPDRPVSLVHHLAVTQ